MRRGPIILGATMGGSTYFINIMVAGFARADGADGGRVTMLYVPGLGTWGLVGNACSGDNDNDGCSFLVLHSAAHSVGVALLVYGIAAPRTVLVRDDVSLTLAPGVARSQGTLNLLGSF